MKDETTLKKKKKTHLVPINESRESFPHDHSQIK